MRLHTDDSIEVRYFNKPASTGISQMAFSFTGDAGCEYGSGITCHGGKAGPKQALLDWMAYDRTLFQKNLLALTLGGGMLYNPGRYLTLLPPINGAEAVSGSPYFPENPGDKTHMWDASANLKYMAQEVHYLVAGGYRHSDVPTGRAPEALRLRAAITELPRCMSAKPERRLGPAISRRLRQPAAAQEVFGSRIFAEVRPPSLPGSWSSFSIDRPSAG